MSFIQAAKENGEFDHIVWHSFDSKEACAKALANDLAKHLKEAQSSRKHSSLVVSGGGTPLPMFKALKEAPLDWAKVTVTLADERWVGASDNDSNEKLVRENLLPSASKFVSLKNSAPSAEEGEEKANQAIAAIAESFDAVVLGMGGDGHTASLFPNHAKLSEALDLNNPKHCMAINDAPKPPPERMTMTASALLNSHWLVIHITGEDKLAVLEKALKEGDSTELPIAAFLHQKDVPIAIYWAA